MNFGQKLKQDYKNASNTAQTLTESFLELFSSNKDEDEGDCFNENINDEFFRQRNYLRQDKQGSVFRE